MGHHKTESGDFKSDKYPELAQNKIVLSFKDPAAQAALKIFCKETEDRELAKDILDVLQDKFNVGPDY